MASQFPEHSKLEKISDKSQAIGEFIEWMHTQGFHMGTWEDDLGEVRFWPASLSITQQLAKFYDIDLETLEDEKLQMLEQQRELNETA
jgi:hypothetical protein